MKADFRKSFKKEYKKFDSKIQNAFNSRLMMFYENPTHPFLKKSFPNR